MKNSLFPRNLQRQRKAGASQPGFALIVTLVMMVLLMILALGLLNLSTISLRKSGVSTASATARNNARLAMMLAIGELQKHAGPDQRITATADMAGTANGSNLPIGGTPANNTSINGTDQKGLTGVQFGTRNWTGVWRNKNLTTPDATLPGTDIFTKTPSLTHLQWLVSGNESLSAANSLKPALAEYSVASNGAVSNPRTAVVLVGRETVGTPSPESLPRYVAAPLVSISKRTGSATNISGRYAWWIGDEGVKAKINSQTTNSDPASYASLSAQRRGWETVAGFSEYPSPTSPAQDSLSKVIDLPQAQLLMPGAGNKNGGVSPIQAAFHSATTDSRAVIVDTLNGGTRIDLSSTLAGSLPTTSRVPRISNYPIAGANIVPRTAAPSMRAPRWDAMKDFYDRSKSLTNGELIVTPATSSFAASIAPLITDFRLMFGVKFSPAANPGSFKANACGKIAIALANPYSAPLKWNSDLEIEVKDITPPGNRPSRIWDLGTNSIFISANEPSVFNNTIFRIRSATLAPGEARAYTVGAYTLRPIGTGMQRVVIDLVPFGSGAPFDFNRCVELDAPGFWPRTNADGTVTQLPPLDVRESWQTTLIAIEMRSSSSGEPLRRVERFDLDNGLFQPNRRSFTVSDMAATTGPVPLMCYNYQVSQPGENYLPLMPAGYEMGQRASTLRTFMDFNLQATRIGKPIASYNPPPYFMNSNDSLAKLPTTPPGGDTGPFFTTNLDTVMPWGRAWTGSQRTVLFSVPSQFTSLAQFQHADLTGDDVAASIGHQPGNAFANSYATPFVKRTLSNQSRSDYEIVGSPNTTGVNPRSRNYYDISYLLNASLWDGYFLSTIRPGSANATPENPSLVVMPGIASLTDPVDCATRLMIDGAFNINSTDKDAWKAFLGSSRFFKHKAETTPVTTAAFPRSLEQLSPSAAIPTGTDADSFSGFRRLSDAELDSLATEIVKQVRLRGPFVSLSHFVNRAIGDISRQPALTRSGALQSAIDESGATINFAGNKKAFTRIDPTTDRVTLAEKQGAPRADLDGGDTSLPFPNVDPSNPDWAVTSADNNYGAVASIIADRALLNTAKTEQGYRSTGIPGWLTQADILQVIGPSITARSDTFRIRTYGEALDSEGKIVATAYCEAIVQRGLPYVDSSNSAIDRGPDLTSVNKFYGRQFSIVSFRWLSPQEI